MGDPHDELETPQLIYIHILQNPQDFSLVGGPGHPSEKYEFVNWDDDINPILSNINGTIKNGNQTTNQKIVIQQW